MPEQECPLRLPQGQVHLAVAAIMALSVALRLPFVGAPLTVDEGAVAYVAYWWQRGYPLYDAVWVDRPQGIFLAYALGMRLLGESTEGLRLFGALYGTIPCLFVYLIGARLLGPRRGLLGAFFHAVLAAHPVIEGYNPSTDLYMGLPATISAYLLLIAYEERPGGKEGLRSAWLLVAAGAMAGLAFLMKQSGIVALFLALFWACYEERLLRRQGMMGEVMRKGIAVVAGFVLALGPSVIHGLSTVPLDYLDAVTHYRWTGASFWAYPVAYQAAQFLKSFTQVLPPLAPFFLSAWWSLILGPRPAFLYCWLIASLMGMAIAGDWFEHYYVQIAPPLALLAAHGAGQLWGRRRESPAMSLAIRVMAGLVGLFLGYTFYFYGAATPEERFSRVLRQPRYLTSDAIGQYLKERTDPGDTIYVAYSGANIVYLSGRLSATKYLFARPLFFIPGAYDDFLARLVDSERQPEYIVVDMSYLRIPLQQGDSRFTEILATYYVPEVTFSPGYVIYRRLGGD